MLGMEQLGCEFKSWHCTVHQLDTYPMFIEPTITWVPSGFSAVHRYGFDTKIVLKKIKMDQQCSSLYEQNEMKDLYNIGVNKFGHDSHENARNYPSYQRQFHKNNCK